MGLSAFNGGPDNRSFPHPPTFLAYQKGVRLLLTRKPAGRIHYLDLHPRPGSEMTCPLRAESPAW